MTQKVQIEGVQYIKASKAEFFALVSAKGTAGAKSTFFYLSREDMIRLVENCPELLNRNQTDTLVWKGSNFIDVRRALNVANIHHTMIPCNMAKKDMPLDANGNRATTQEKFISDFFGGRWIGGLKSGGGVSESGRMADVKTAGGFQIEVKGFYGRLACRVSLDTVKTLYKDGIFDDKDMKVIQKRLQMTETEE